MVVTTESIFEKNMTVRITNVDTSRYGKIMVMLFSESGFPKIHDQGLEIKTIQIDKNKNILNFEFNIKMENLTIKVFHDEDMTGKVSKNWIGFIIPSEGLGFSNGENPGLGPPSFESAMLKRYQSAGVIEIPVIYS